MYTKPLNAASVFGLALVFSVSCVDFSFAQTKVQEGENVRVLFLNDWYDATVVDTDKQQVMAEFFFARSVKQEVFHRSNVRKMCEVDAIDFCRTWESATGEFSVVAALKDVENEEVILIKDEDLEEVRVPLDQLSNRDVTYVKKMTKSNDQAVARGQIPARTPDLPDLEFFESGFGTFSNITYADKSNIEPFGETPSYLREFEHTGMGFNMVRNDQELVAVIPVGGPDQLVLMTAREDNRRSFNDLPFQSQVYWVSLRQKKVLGSVAITPDHFPLDYDPSTELLLTYYRNRPFKNFDTNTENEANHYAIWKMEPGGSKAEPIIRWQADAVDWASNFFSKIVNDHVIVTKADRHTYVGWDFVNKKRIYTIKPQSFFDAPVTISPDRNYLILPEDGNVSVLDAATGETKMRFSVADRHVSGANIDPDGKKLVAVTERNVYVWDLESRNPEPSVHPAPLIGSPFSSRVEWIDEDHILSQSSRRRILFRLSLNLPIWSYEMDVRDYFLNRDPLKNSVIDGMFFYVVKPDPFSGAIAVGSVELPGPGVKEVTGNIDPDSLMILYPGASVSLDTGQSSEPQQVRKWLTEKIEANGWIIDPDAEIKVIAKNGVGPTTSVTYEEIGNPSNTRTVSFQPRYATLEIKKGDMIIWQTGTSTGPPPVIRTNSLTGGDFGGGRYSQSQVKFFEHVEIEAKIMDPKYANGFGVSKLGLRGIEVLSTTPPGRADDPHAADQQADQDARDSYDKKDEGDKEDKFR